MDSQKCGVVFLSRLDLILVGEPVQTAAGPWLISLDKLVAWGSGKDRLSVYETIVARPKRTPNMVPALIGRRRVRASYDIDVPVLAKAVESIRAAVQAWEAGLGDFRKHLKAQPVVDEADIIVTSAEAGKPSG